MCALLATAMTLPWLKTWSENLASSLSLPGKEFVSRVHYGWFSDQYGLILITVLDSLTKESISGTLRASVNNTCDQCFMNTF